MLKPLVQVIIKLANSPHLSVMLAAAEGLDHFCSNPNYQVGTFA